MQTPSKVLSAANTPTLRPAASDPEGRLTGPQKYPASAEAPSRDSPRWPVSPRLRSPPPQLNRPSFSSRRNDTDPPRISLQRATPSPVLPEPASAASESETDDMLAQSGLRTPAMSSGSMLETVQEVSQPNSPGQLDSALAQVSEKLAGDNGFNPLYPILADNKILNLKSPVDNASDISARSSEARRSASAAPPAITRQSSALSAKQGKTKAAGEGSAKAMIVETETVSSVPQVALAPGSKAESVNGTLKAKPSTETIRPKKEKKKNSRKQPAVAQGTGELPSSITNVSYHLRHHRSMRSVSTVTDGGASPIKMHGQGLCPEEAGSRLSSTPGSRASSISFSVSSLLTRPRPASSKADIFEAKVASAVDEADTSDSEETFVYDSNPPDGGDRPRRFHHSRTPSATSMASQADRTAMRSIHSVMENTGPPVTMKKGMKFVNSFAGNVSDSLTTGDDDGKGSGRSVGPGSTRGTVRHHHNHLTHIGRWGRNGGNSHPSLFDNESPFAQATRPKFSGTASRQSSQPPSPRFPNSRGVSQSIKKSSMQGHSYDLDDTTGADDERTPLITPSMRSNRSRGRRNPASLRHLESQTYRQRPSYLNRFAACLVVTMMLLLVITGAIGFMFATSQPLTDIELVSITNVIASDPELMFDMTVRAHNPNIVVVSIDQANIEVFAKSIHAGTDGDWWKQPDGPDDAHITDDPPPDDDPAPNMRLGAISEFDSPLSFEGSFFNKGVSTSTGEMRLALPGNHTAGGSERWSRIIQDEFDLVLKGVVRYSLPLSQRVRSAPISGRTTVKPNSANDPSFNSTLPTDGSDIS